MNTLSAGLVIASPKLLEEVRAALLPQPVSVVLAETGAGNTADLLEKVGEARPDVLFVELFGPTGAAEEILRRLKAAPGAPAIVAVQETVEGQAIVAAMRAGADEYLYPPFGARLEAALERVAGSRGAGKQPARRGMTLAFLSAKGGCGATTMACHIAAEFQRQTEQKILLADLDMDAGLVRFLLKSKSPYTISDAALSRERLDASFWKGLVSNGTPRLEVITAPPISSAPRPEANALRHVLAFTRYQYDWILADLGRSLSPYSMSLLEEAEECFIVTTSELPALYQAKQIIRTLTDAGYGKTRLHVVLNRVPKYTDIIADRAGELLGMPIYGSVTEAPEELGEACSAAGLVAPGSAPGLDFGRLAARILGKPAPQAKRRFSIFGGGEGGRRSAGAAA